MKYLAIIALIATCAPAYAQDCMATHDAHDQIGELYGEEVVFSALKDDGSLVEIFGADESWTMIQTFPDGRSCYVAHGEGYDIPARKPTL